MDGAIERAELKTQEGSTATNVHLHGATRCRQATARQGPAEAATKHLEGHCERAYAHDLDGLERLERSLAGLEKNVAGWGQGLQPGERPTWTGGDTEPSTATFTGSHHTEPKQRSACESTISRQDAAHTHLRTNRVLHYGEEEMMESRHAAGEAMGGPYSPDSWGSASERTAGGRHSVDHPRQHIGHYTGYTEGFPDFGAEELREESCRMMTDTAMQATLAESQLELAAMMHQHAEEVARMGHAQEGMCREEAPTSQRLLEEVRHARVRAEQEWSQVRAGKNRYHEGGLG